MRSASVPPGLEALLRSSDQRRGTLRARYPHAIRERLKALGHRGPGDLQELALEAQQLGVPELLAGLVGRREAFLDRLQSLGRAPRAEIQSSEQAPIVRHEQPPA